MSKYYTPEIEEFYVGFEFEEKWEDGWQPEEYAIHSFINTDILNNKVIRVKYLDREDIESLGWKWSLIQNRGKYTTLFFKESDPMYASWTLELTDTSLMQEDGKYVSDKKEINTVCVKFFHPDDASGQTIFYGTIKNKSELKKVLKMLGL